MTHRPSVTSTIALLAIVTCLTTGCGDLFSSDEDGKEGLAPPAPTDVIGFLPIRGDSDLHVRLRWLAEDSDSIAGCFIYRSDGTHRYEPLTEDPIEPGYPGTYAYFDENAYDTSTRNNIYCVTAVSEDGVESDPSPFVLVPASAVVEPVPGLSPADGTTGVTLTPEFTWEPVEGADSYFFTLIEDSLGAGPVIWQCRIEHTRLAFWEGNLVTYVPFTSGRLRGSSSYEAIILAMSEDNFAFARGSAKFSTVAGGPVPPAPTDVIGSFREFDGGWAFGIWWLVGNPAELQGCNVYRRIGDGTPIRLNDDPVPVFGVFHDIELNEPPPEAHSYHVRAVAWDGTESDPSDEVIVPSEISGVDVSILSPEIDAIDVSVLPTFSWDPVQGSESYLVVVVETDLPPENFTWAYRNTGTSFLCGETGGTTYIPLHNGRLAAETSCTWTVGCVDENNFVFGGAIASFTTESEAVPPPSPTDIMGALVNRSGEISIILRWAVANAEELLGCNIYRKIADGPYELITPEPVPPDSSFSDDETDDDQLDELRYYVTSVDTAHIESAPSPEVIVPADFHWAPFQILTPEDGETDVPLIPIFGWDPVDGAETYCVMLSYAGAPGGDFLWLYRDVWTHLEFLRITGVTYVPFDGVQLLPNTEYRLRVRTVDASNFQFSGGEVHFTTGSGGVQHDSR